MKITYSNDTITPEEVVRFLSLTGQSQSIYNQIIIHKEVVKKARELGLEVSDDQLQRFADNFRSLKGFDSAQEMLEFLAENYCVHDIAWANGFNPDMKFEMTKNFLLGDEYCEFTMEVI